MKPTIFTKLSVMMFLEYFIWGAWYVTMGTYMTEFLKSSGVQIGAAYSALAIATMISPFFIGMVADQYFAAQNIMGVFHIVGGVLLYFATQITDNTTFYWVILLYSLLYMPTIALSNNIAFSQMTDPGKQFPWIRVFGTVGWIAAGIMIGVPWNRKDRFNISHGCRCIRAFRVDQFYTSKYTAKRTRRSSPHQVLWVLRHSCSSKTNRI